MLTLLEFMQNQKWLILICCLLSVLFAAIPLFGKKHRKNPPLFLLFYGAYLLWLGLGVFWAVSGSFFLREYSKHLLALPLALYILLLLPRKESSVRKLLFLLSAIGAFYAFLSIDNVTTGIFRPLLNLIPGFRFADTGYESGTRLFGIFSNGNISAGVLAICIFFSLYLLESAANRRQRVFAVIFAVLQASTFLLNFSMGATGFFLVSVVIYLVFAGEKRIRVLFRMLEIALPTVISVFLTFRFFEVSGSRKMIPMLAVLLSSAAAVALELIVFPRLSRFFEKYNRKATGAIAAFLVIIGAYIVLGLLLRGDAEIAKGQFLRRSCYPDSGDYSLSVTAEGDVNVRILSQNERETIMHTSSSLYSGPAAEAVFTVPEDSLVVYLTFTSPEGARLKEVTLLGNENHSLHLGYPLLPGFIANRLQGLLANENAIQRGAFFRDGMKVFRDYPVFGAGLGSFETLLFGYQDFYYETKYVHNHYIQVLLDSGIIGLLLYAAILLLTAVTLWKARKKDTSDRILYPALCAAFVMLVLHSSMEVIMSASVFLPYAYAVLSLIAVCFAPETENKTAKTASIVIPGFTALIYAVLIIFNLSADAAVRKSTDNATRFFSALEYAAKVDAFEKNDWKVSYISTCADFEINTYRYLADRYAVQLMDVPSNSLHQHLIRYYLVFRNYDMALKAAKQSVHFNYSDKDTWNSSFSLFASAISEHPEDEAEILSCVRMLNDELQHIQERLMEPIQLDSVSKTLIEAALRE